MQTINQRIAFEGIQQIIAQLQKMGVTGERAIGIIHQQARISKESLGQFHAEADRAGNSLKNLATHATALEGAFNKGVNTLNRYTKSFGELRGIVAALAPALRELGEAGLGVSALFLSFEGARKAAESIREMKNQADTLGISLKELGGAKVAFAALGISVEDGVRALGRLESAIGRSIEKSKEQARVEATKNAEADHTAAADQERARKAEEAIDRTARQEQIAAGAVNRERIQRQQLNLEIDKSTLSTRQLREERAKLGPGPIPTDTRLKEQIKDQGASIALQTRRLALHDSELKDANAQIDATQAHAHAITERNLALQQTDIDERKARDAAEKDIDVFHRLGITLTDSSGKAKSVITVAGELGDAFAKMTNDAEKARDAQELIGRGFLTVLPYLKLGSDAVKAFNEEAVKLGVVPSQAEQKMAEAFNEAFDKLSLGLQGLRRTVGNVLGQAFVPFFNAISGLIERNRDDIISFAQSFSDALSAIGRALSPFGTLIAEAFKTLNVALDVMLGLISAVVGIDISKSELITGVLIAIGVFSAWKLAVLATSVSLALLGGVLTTLKGPLSIILKGIEAVRTALIAMVAVVRIGGFVALFAAIGPVGWIITGVVAIGSAVLTLTGTWGKFFNFMSEGLHNLKITWDAFLELIESVIEALLKLAGVQVAAKSSSEQKVSDAEYSQRADQEAADNRSLSDYNKPIVPTGRQAGGPIPGSGSGDHVHVLAEPGEFMVKKPTVQRLGLDFMHALNSGLIQRFAMGGLVRGLGMMHNPLPMATGGPVPAMGSATERFSLSFEGRTFGGLSASQRTADDMIEHARMSSIISLGQRPSRKGGG